MIDYKMLLGALAGGPQGGMPGGGPMPAGVRSAQGIMPPGFSMMGVMPTGPGNMGPPRQMAQPAVAQAAQAVAPQEMLKALAGPMDAQPGGPFSAWGMNGGPPQWGTTK